MPPSPSEPHPPDYQGKHRCSSTSKPPISNIPVYPPPSFSSSASTLPNSTANSMKSSSIPAPSEDTDTPTSSTMVQMFESLAPSSSTSLSPSERTSPVSQHLNVGAIAGGTVGGFVVLASLGLIAFLWLARRRQHRIAPSAAYTAAYGTTPPPTFPKIQSISPSHQLLPSQASYDFVVSSTRNTIFDGHRSSVAF